VCSLTLMTLLIVKIPYSRFTRLRNRLAAASKWILSFGKHDWQLKDYPIRLAKLESDSPFRSPRFRKRDYRASIINWGLMGSGNTPEEAIDALRVNLESVKQTGKQTGTPLIRPGSHVEVEFASQARISAYAELSDDFVRRVLGWKRPGFRTSPPSGTFTQT
jgi:hypothetical protein